MKPLTKRQAAILAYIKHHLELHHNLPVVREIAREFKFKSPHGADCHLRALEAKGYLERLEHQMGYRLVGVAVRLEEDHATV